MIETLDALCDIFDDDSAAFDQRAFQDRYGDLMIVAANEHGELVYATMPTDDPDSDGPFVGIITAKNVAWPLVPLFPIPDTQEPRSISEVIACDPGDPPEGLHACRGGPRA